MSYENVIKKAKKIENALSDMGAEGKGLNEKLNSIEHKFDEKVIKAIRFIATIRNKLVHEDDFEMDYDLEEGFDRTYDFIINNINQNESTYEESSSYSSSSSSYNSSNGTDDLMKLWDSLSGWQKVGAGVLATGALALYAWFNNV